MRIASHGDHSRSTSPTGMPRSARACAAAGSPASSSSCGPTTAGSAGARPASVPTPPRSTQHCRRCARSSSAAAPGMARPSRATSTAPGSGTIASRPATSPSPASTWRCGTCAARTAGQPLHRLFGGPVQRGDRVLLLPGARLAGGAEPAVRRRCRARLSLLLPQGRHRRGGRGGDARGGARRRSGRRRESGSTPTRPGPCPRRSACSSAGTAASASTSPRRRCRSSRSSGCATCGRARAVALCANEGLGSAADAYRVIASGVADIVCFSSYWVGTLRRFHTLASLAGLLGIGVCKHTHGELGDRRRRRPTISCSRCPTPRRRAADGRDHGRRSADGALPIATGPRWGVPDAPGPGHRGRRGKLMRFADDYRRDGQFLPYAA